MPPWCFDISKTICCGVHCLCCNSSCCFSFSHSKVLTRRKHCKNLPFFLFSGKSFTHKVKSYPRRRLTSRVSFWVFLFFQAGARSKHFSAFCCNQKDLNFLSIIWENLIYTGTNHILSFIRSPRSSTLLHILMKSFVQIITSVILRDGV